VISPAMKEPAKYEPNRRWRVILWKLPLWDCYSIWQVV